MYVNVSCVRVFVLTAFSDTLCPNNSNFHFRQRRFFPSYTSRSHSYRHTDRSCLPRLDILFTKLCMSVYLFVCFSRLCCDSVTFLSSLFTNRPKKTTKLQNWNKTKKKQNHMHTLFLFVSLSSNSSSNFSVGSYIYVLFIYLVDDFQFRLYFSFRHSLLNLSENPLKILWQFHQRTHTHTKKSCEKRYIYFNT